MTSLVDTNVLVYRFDPRFPAKQEVATRLLREGVVGGELVVPHQAIVEFVAVTSRPRDELGNAPLLEPDEARREAEELLAQFPIAYPDDSVLRTALRGAAAYRLSWFDAHLLGGRRGQRLRRDPVRRLRARPPVRERPNPRPLSRRRRRGSRAAGAVRGLKRIGSGAAPPPTGPVLR